MYAFIIKLNIIHTYTLIHYNYYNTYRNTIKKYNNFIKRDAMVKLITLQLASVNRFLFIQNRLNQINYNGTFTAYTHVQFERPNSISYKSRNLIICFYTNTNRRYCIVINNIEIVRYFFILFATNNTE